MPTAALTVLQAKFPAYLAWSQPFLHELIRALDLRQRNVVVCTRVENPDRFPVRNLCRVSEPSLMYPSLAVLLASRIRRDWRPSAIHAHFGWSGIRMLLLKHFLQIPLVTTFGGRDASAQMDLPRFDRLYALLLASSERIVCVSESLRRELLARGADPERVEVVRRGTRLDRFQFVDRSERDRSRPLRVLMVGRLVEKKGHRYVFEALGQLVREGHELALRVVGEGEGYAELVRLQRELGLRGRVEFLGTLSHDAVRAEMREADVLVQGSVTAASGDREGLPNAVIEAAATGLALVATRHGGIQEAVEHEKTALLVDERDVAQLTAALRALALRPALRLELGRAAADRMRTEFDFERQVERHHALYGEIARAGARPAPMPDEFPELLAGAMRAERNGSEFSVAELLELALRRRAPKSAAPDQVAWLERAYALKRYVPQSLKFWAKARLTRVLSRGAVESLHGRRDTHALDSLTLARFALVPDLGPIDPSWSVGELAQHWGASA